MLEAWRHMQKSCGGGVQAGSQPGHPWLKPICCSPGFPYATHSAHNKPQLPGGPGTPQWSRPVLWPCGSHSPFPQVRSEIPDTLQSKPMCGRTAAWSAGSTATGGLARASRVVDRTCAAATAGTTALPPGPVHMPGLRLRGVSHAGTGRQLRSFQRSLRGQDLCPQGPTCPVPWGGDTASQSWALVGQGDSRWGSGETLQSTASPQLLGVARRSILSPELPGPSMVCAQRILKAQT